MDAARVAAFRQRRHGATPADVAAATCGIHAQVMGTTDLQVGARAPVPAADAVARALWVERSLVRVWCMRGTLHLLTPDGEALTRRELGAAVTARAGARLGARLGSSWGELLKPAARRGLSGCAGTCARTARPARRTTRAGWAYARSGGSGHCWPGWARR